MNTYADCFPIACQASRVRVILITNSVAFPLRTSASSALKSHGIAHCHDTCVGYGRNL